MRERVYGPLAKNRAEHPGLRSHNFYPETSPNGFNAEGYGVDSARCLAIYHRWGNDSAARLERFIVVIDFGDDDQTVDVPFSENGVWSDLLSGMSIDVLDFKLTNQTISSNWGKIYYRRTPDSRGRRV